MFVFNYNIIFIMFFMLIIHSTVTNKLDKLKIETLKNLTKNNFFYKV